MKASKHNYKNDRVLKRRCKPSFFLGVCYSAIKSRVQHKNYNKHFYHGLKVCTKKQFMNKFLKDRKFLRLYKVWQKSKFQRRLSPSIDRIDSSKGYTLNNIRFVPQHENSRQGAFTKHRRYNEKT